MIDKIGENLGIVAGIIGSLGIIVAARKKVAGVFVAIYRYFTGPSRIERKIDARIEQSELAAKTLDRICYALFNGGNEGIVQQVARLSACHSAAFESAPYPSFECSSAGANTRVNEAYRILTEVWSSKNIENGRWQQAIHGELATRYCAEFARCAAAKDDFVAVCDFKNPMTDEHRGRWRVYAPAAQIGDDCLYVGRFIAAIDDTARNIAMEEGWQVKMG